MILYRQVMFFIIVIISLIIRSRMMISEIYFSTF